MEPQIRSVLVIWNRAAGIWQQANWQQKWIEDFGRHFEDVQVFFSQTLEDISELTRMAVNGDFDLLVAAGGDGTLHLVASELASLENPDLPVLSQIPFGSGNDFLRQYNFHKRHLADPERLAKGTVIPIDMGQCGDNWFINGVGFGLAADVGQAFHESRFSGTFPYLLYSLREIRRNRSLRLKIELESETIEERCCVAAIGNGPFSGGGFCLTPNAIPNDGLLDICLINSTTRLSLFRQLPKAFKGRHLNSPLVTYRQVRNIALSADEPIIAQLDGEILPPQKEWEITVHPERLKFLVPANA